MSDEHIHEHGDHCDCGCDHDEAQIMNLVLDDDTELQCNVLGIFDVDENSYIALLPVGEEEVLIYKYIEDDGEEGFTLENIEDDDEFDMVEEAFFDIFGDEEFEADEEEEE